MQRSIVTPNDLMDAALVLCMEHNQVQMLHDYQQTFLAKGLLPVKLSPIVASLHQFAGHEDIDVEDPFYMDDGGYRIIAKEIQQCVLESIPKLEKLVSQLNRA